ncbi:MULTISPECIES: hypothetical protein [Aeromonas]|uniref:hypothetical protein n=1 Tax=Aeromonas TaxID=642 RepID=UPI00259DB245|nr:hypothetical protein [Aeromonas salmonicida]MDM5112822.1 hypothetical protein [Aeromonas salmonicida]
MLMTEYPLCYWQRKGIFTSEIHGEAFMEFRVSQLLGAGNSAIRQLIVEQERSGRDLMGCRAELAAYQEIARSCGMGGVIVLTEELNQRSGNGT